MAQGYRPVAVSVAETRPGQPLVTASVWQAPQVSAAAREARVRRQAGAVLTLARLGQPERVYPLLAHSGYPEARSRLIQRLGPGGVSAETLAARLEREQDVSVRRALILALGEYQAGQVSPSLRGRLVPTLLAWYRDDPDPGIHGAIDWLLRHDHEGPAPRRLDWRQAKALQRIDDDLASQMRTSSPRIAGDRRDWYVNGQGHTLTIVDARAPFLMGSPSDEVGRGTTETLHWRRIGRRYAIGAKPVTVAQFRRFLAAHPEVRHGYVKSYSPPPEAAITSVIWYEAAQFCRWLSEEEGFPEHEMPYPSVAVLEKCKDGLTPLRLPRDHLRRKGYRLPTEAEWEFACRAGARTSRYYGSSVDLLPRYAWYSGNAEDRFWPVGQKRPNDLGLFDMHGTVWTWCQDGIRTYPSRGLARPAPDAEDNRPLVVEDARAVRGASFDSYLSDLRAAHRDVSRPRYRGFTVGLRVVRTCD
jgi:formylglycine-generating enzyme required for sulfatase activity